MPYGSLIEFTFSDDPKWRDAITSIRATINSLADPAGENIGYLQKTVGIISLQHPERGYYGSGTWVWTIKATGYEDVVVTLVVN